MPNCSREAQIKDFLTANNWGEAQRTPVPGDASARRYEKLVLKGKLAVLMDAPQDPDGVACLAETTHGEREKLGYNGKARLSGTSLSAFICLATALTRRGFAAPRILAADIEAGLLLLEDLGDTLYASVLTKSPIRELQLYQNAITCLAAIYRSSFARDLRAQGLTWHVGDYDALALHTEADLFLEWYMPYFETSVTEAAKAEWQRIWAESLPYLDAHAPGLALRDFHAENIFDLNGRVGLIDFQDALFAHPSYDLVSLLEDARRDVSTDIVAPLISQFCQEAGIVEDDKFIRAYAVQGAQRNAKILGIFVRLAVRDGKKSYLNLLPRVRTHFKHDLNHPALAELKIWCEAYAPSVLDARR